MRKFISNKYNDSVSLNFYNCVERRRKTGTRMDCISLCTCTTYTCVSFVVSVPFSVLSENRNNDRYTTAVQFSSCDVNEA